MRSARRQSKMERMSVFPGPQNSVPDDLSPMGNPGTLAPAGERGSKRVPSLNHVAKVQIVPIREVVIDAQPGLIRVVLLGLGRSEGIESGVGQGKERQEALSNRADEWGRQLVVGKWRGGFVTSR